jgi:hypothetical protein
VCCLLSLTLTPDSDRLLHSLLTSDIIIPFDSLSRLLDPRSTRQRQRVRESEIDRQLRDAI